MTHAPQPLAPLQARRGALIVGALTVALTGGLLSYQLAHHHDLLATFGDEPGYHWRAVNLVEHGVYVRYHTVPYAPDTFVVMPGYSLFLAALYRVVGPEPVVALLLQALVAGLVAALVYALPAGTSGRVAGATASVVLLGELGLVVFGSALMSETVGTALLVGGLYLAVTAVRPGERVGLSWQPLIGASVLLGLAALVRPTAIMAAPAIWLGLALSHRRPVVDQAKLLAVLSLGTVLAVGGWVGRNALVYHATGLTSVASNLQLRAALDVVARAEGQDSAQAFARQCQAVEAAQSNPFARDRAAGRLCSQTLRQHWPIAARQYALGCAKTLAAPSANALRRVSDPAGWGSWLGLGLWPLWLAGLALAAVGLLHGWRNEAARPVVLSAALLAAGFIGAAGLVGQARYRAPVVPMLALLAGFGAAQLVQMWRARRGAVAPPR